MPQNPVRERSQQSLRDALDTARLPPRDYRIYSALLRRADWRTGDIPERFQPRSLERLTDACGLMSRTAVAAGLTHLELHGWLMRHRLPPGRGHSTSYALAFGADCDCAPEAERPRPLTEAERARRYRERRKARAFRVTEEAEGSGIDVTKHPGVTHEAAGDLMVSAEEAAKGEGLVREGLTVTIAGVEMPAMECRGNCGLLVPVEFAFGGYHMHCGGPEDAECGTTGEAR